MDIALLTESLETLQLSYEKKLMSNRFSSDDEDDFERKLEDIRLLLERIDSI